MTAKELAEILLRTPDKQVYIEEHHAPEFSDWYTSVSTIDGSVESPDGIFLQYSSMEYEEEKKLKAPHNVPKIDSIRMFQTVDGVEEEILSSEHDDCALNLHDLMSDMEYYGEVSLYNDGEYIYIRKETTNPKECDYPEILTSEITRIQVIVTIDDQWEPVYKDMTFDEAEQYFLSKYPQE